MKTKLAGMFVLVAVFILANTATAQFTITIPKIPKIKKTQPQPSQTPEPSAESPSTPASPETPETPATPARNDCSDPFTEVHNESMRKTLKEAEEYTPTLRNYYVQDFNDNRNEYLWAAISPSRRKEWLTDHNIKTEDYGCFVPLFDQIATAAKKTLPTYQPKGYTLGTPAEFKLIRDQVNDLSNATVIKVGVKSPNWIIEKDNYNFPTARFKYGMVWARYPTKDDGYCRIIFVNIVQDYAGGGTYGASYGSFIKSEPAGCAAGK
ncbi:MAG TPA: hypothetical protein VGQ55_10490 [Pyrinomonadaceae bacterium]|jgi:hypothetical protein|nr:hypothetical protein [Pyrinomonadaceae bacterium]